MTHLASLGLRVAVSQPGTAMTLFSGLGPEVSLIERGEGWSSDAGVPPPEAGARQERTLEAVSLYPALGGFQGGG
jgi:hypothetical protein